MAEVPQGENATFSFLDFFTLAFALEIIPAFERGKIVTGLVLCWLAFANHAIAVKWRTARLLIPPMAVTLFIYAFMWCIGMSKVWKYTAATLSGAIILPLTLLAYDWINKRPEASHESTAKAQNQLSESSQSSPSATTPPLQAQTPPKLRQGHKPQSSEALMPHSLGNKYSQMSTPRLGEAGVYLAGRIRKMTQDWMVEEDRITKEQVDAVRNPSLSPQDQQKGWDNGTKEEEVAHTTFMNTYNSTYRTDAMLLHTELLYRSLPGTKSLPDSQYQYPTNPLGVEAVADDLEKLAKGLPEN